MNSSLTAVVPARPRLRGDGNHVRLGLVWVAVSALAITLGPIPTAVVHAPLALAAAGQASRAWTRPRKALPKAGSVRRPHRLAAIAAATAIALSAGFGSPAMAVVALLAGGASFAAATVLRPANGPPYDAVVTAAIALLGGIGAGVIPLARAELGFVATAALLLVVFASDASWYLIGTDARFRLEAPVASFAAVGVVTVAIAAVLVPPFRGMSPWVLGGIAGVLLPIGPRVASAALPDPDAFAPALRRVDSLLVAGPVWVVVASAILDLP